MPRWSAITWRQLLLGTLGASIGLYAVCVLAYVVSTPYVGVHCVFSTVVNRAINPQVLRSDGAWFQTHPRPHVTRLGEETVEVWPQFLQALLKLKDQAAPEVADLNPATTAAARVVRYQGEKLVRIDFEHPDVDPLTGGKSQFAGWFVVGRLPTEELVPSVLWFALKLGLFLVGAFVLWKRPNDDSAAHFFVLCTVTLGAYMGGYHWAHIVPNPPLLIGFMVCGVLLPAAVLHFYVVFPRPKAVYTKHPRLVAVIVYGPPLAFLTLLLVSYGWIYWLVHGAAAATKVLDTAEIERALAFLRSAVFVYLGVAGIWYMASVVCLVLSFRHACDVTERNQVKCILVGSVLALPPIAYSIYLAVWQQQQFASGAATWWMFAASLCFTVAFAVSITRYRLMQLDQLISSGVSYFVVSSLGGLVYYAIFFLLMLASQGVSSPSLAQALTVCVSVLVLMLLLDWARGRLKKALDRRFYREKHQLDGTLRRMRQAIEQLVDPPTLARRLLHASADLLGVASGSVYLSEGEPPFYRLVGSQGVEPPLTELAPGCPLIEAVRASGTVMVRGITPADRQLRFLGGEVALALAHEGTVLAVLVLGARRSGGGYGEEDLNLLAGFGQITALALESASRHRTIEMLNSDLQGKVEKISEQQRRILALQNQLTRRAVDPATTPTVEANGQPSTDAPAGMIGSSAVVRQLLYQVRKVAPSPSAVLIRGESGTGKELIAQAVHDHSPRAGKAFVKVHCAALSPGLLESELFGHVRGAFTGAHRDKVGRFELANGGTLFLDEIGDIALDVQVKLLRVLQEKTFERVGASDPVHVDVRIIAATHQNLEELIRQGRFREDLFYRLNVLPIRVPPLRERREDVVELALHFARLYSQGRGHAITTIEDEALVLLKGYRWPGNIRELQNVIERAVAIAEGDLLTPNELPLELLQATKEVDEWEDDTDDEPALVPSGIRAERAARDTRERERLVRALAAAAGNKSEAARALGLARSTLVSRLKKFGLT